MTETEKNFLSLVRLGIGKEATTTSSFDCPDWIAIEALAEEQGLSAIVIDGLEKAPGGIRPPKEVLLQWIGTVIHAYEQRYELYRRAIAEMAGFYHAHGVKMMVLKGFACGLDWPRPEHRPCGDIDIWQFGCYREADALLASEKGISVDTSHHHHTVFHWRGFMVENHYDFINVHHHKSHREMECIFKELGQDDSYSVAVNSEPVYLPSPNLHALFLLKHLMMHFASGKISMRQLLDWAFFAEKHGADVDWSMVLPVLDRFGMKDLFDIFNAICIEDLGFDFSALELQCQPSENMNPDRVADAGPNSVSSGVARVDAALKERVLNEILSPEFSGETPSSLLPRLAFKYRRWRSNEWKHRLCYRESMWSAFWSGIWNHLLKPSSI